MATAAAAAAAFPPLARAAAFAIEPVDTLTLTVVVDAATFAFAERIDRPDLLVERIGGRGTDTGEPRYTLAAEFGLSLLGVSKRRAETRRVLVDCGYTPEVLLNNLAILGLDPGQVDALVLSHAHFDHFGGLSGLLAGNRRLAPKTPVYVGGEEAFCARDSRIGGKQLPFGRIDRAALEGTGLQVHTAPEPAAVAGHAFTTGEIPLRSFERTINPTLMRPGVGCRRELLAAAKRELTLVPDDMQHELATCWVVKDRGLVVTSSCSHRGVLNAVLRARAVTGIDKVHAVIGGFHLVWPREPAEALRTVEELKAIDPDYIVPMHCSGEPFTAAALQAFPERVIRPYVGSQFVFGARGAAA